MYSQERQAKIVDLLGSQSSVSVSVLADMLHTSKETIRRDLKALEAEGILTRTHGGAILNVNTPHVGAAAKFGDAVMNNEYPFALRHIRNIPAKKVIAQKAATLIEDRDTIFIDNSSTTLFLLDYIPQDLHLTIITNSVKVLLEAAKKENSNISLISLAGFYNPNNYSVYGTRTIKSAEEFFPNKTFISCTGVTLNKQLTDISLNEVDTKLAMMRKSEEPTFWRTTPSLRSTGLSIYRDSIPSTISSPINTTTPLRLPRRSVPSPGNTAFASSRIRRRVCLESISF